MRETLSSIELALAAKYPIIPTIARQPAQPTFGNAREGYNKYHITGNILKLDDFPYIDPEPKHHLLRPNTSPLNRSSVCEEYLDKHNISYTADTKSDTRYPDRHFVKCPLAAKHTDGICKEKDSFVWNDGNGFAFFCSHASVERTLGNSSKQDMVSRAHTGDHAPKPVENLTLIKRKRHNPSNLKSLSFYPTKDDTKSLMTLYSQVLQHFNMDSRILPMPIMV